MTIIRATNTAVIPYIQDKITPAEGVSREQYLENLANWLVYSPQTIFMQVAFESDKLLGFMICYLPPQVNYVFVSQTFAETKELATQFLVRASEWGSYQLRTHFRTETESDKDEYWKLWKFSTISETKGIEFSALQIDSIMQELRDERTRKNDTSGNDTPKQDRQSGEAASVLPTGGLPAEASLLTGGVHEGNLHAEGDVGDRTVA